MSIGDIVSHAVTAAVAFASGYFLPEALRTRKAKREHDRVLLDRIKTVINPDFIHDMERNARDGRRSALEDSSFRMMVFFEELGRDREEFFDKRLRLTFHEVASAYGRLGDGLVPLFPLDVQTMKERPEPPIERVKEGAEPLVHDFGQKYDCFLDEVREWRGR